MTARNEIFVVSRRERSAAGRRVQDVAWFLFAQDAHDWVNGHLPREQSMLVIERRADGPS